MVIPGETQPAEVHALAHRMNHALGNVGKTVEYLPRIDGADAGQARRPLAELADDIAAGRVDTLIMLGVNPAYDAPADLKFAELLRSSKVPLADPPWVPPGRDGRGSATGMSPRPTRSSRGATSAPSTARRRSSSP